MIDRIKKWRTNRCELAALYCSAWQAFQEAYPERIIVRWRLKQHNLPTGELIVTVCYGNTKPPRRSWWIRRSGQTGFEELPHDEAEKLIEIPVWR